MAREFLASAAVSGIMPPSPWLMEMFMIAASVCIVSLAVFLCGRSSHTDNHDGIPKKKPAAAKAAKASRPGSSGSTEEYGAAYLAGVTVALGSAGCGGGGGGGGQGSCCGGGGGGGCGGGGGGC